VLGRTLYVGGIRANVTEAQLEERFLTFGKVAHLQASMFDHYVLSSCLISRIDES
jgi:hypothetical protein